MTTDSSGNHATWLDIGLSITTGTTAVPKAVAKLIETVADQVGLYFEPYHIRQRAEAVGDARQIEARANREVKKQELASRLDLKDIKDRAENRERLVRERQQENIERIVEKAAYEIQEEVSDSPVDSDWTAAFFDSCKNIGNDQMQQIWARLLAGQVANPGTFSLQAMSIVRVMSQGHARLFTKLCQTVWKCKGVLYPVITEMNTDPIGDFLGISLEELMTLASLGLVTPPGPGTFSADVSGNGFIPLHYFDKIHGLYVPRKATLALGIVRFTEAGAELCTIAGAAGIEEYRQYSLRYFRANGVRIQEGDLSTFSFDTRQ